MAYFLGNKWKKCNFKREVWGGKIKKGCGFNKNEGNRSDKTRLVKGGNKKEH